ncbi:hypothetical protein Q7P35_004616 [Cladosporium inversicolor]
MHIATVRQLLACDVRHDGHMHRYLFDDNTVRYIKIMTGPHNHHFHDQPLPPIPAGNWNRAKIDMDRKTDQPAFQSVIRRHLETVRTIRTKTWDPPSVDHLNLQLYQGRNRSGRFATYQDSSSDLFKCPIVVKIARFGHEISDIQLECDIYQKILGKGIGTEFLAYVTEDGRIIGFILKKIEGLNALGQMTLRNASERWKRFTNLASSIETVIMEISWSQKVVRSWSISNLQPRSTKAML